MLGFDWKYFLSGIENKAYLSFQFSRSYGANLNIKIIYIQVTFERLIFMFHPCDLLGICTLHFTALMDMQGC